MIHIGVFFGGTSVEHEVSVITALQAIHQLKKMNRYKVVPIYISKQNTWYTGDYLMEIEHFKDLKKVIDATTPVQLVKGEKRAQLVHFKKSRAEVVDVVDLVFPIIHGTGGEDGTLQGLIEHLELPYVGCGVLAAAMTMDKIASKQFLRCSGINVVDGEWFYSHHWLTDQSSILEELEEKLSYPMIVKPADIGSSVGIKCAKNRAELVEAIDEARVFSTRVLVEKMLSKMREINIAVLGDSENMRFSVCEEPISESDFLTYEDKYMSQGTATKGMSGSRRQIPANLDRTMQKTIEQMAVEAFIALDCAGVSRIDFMIDEHTQTPYVNEFNTVPGSLSFYLWEASGVSFKEMLEEMIQAAFRTYRRKQQLTRSNHLNLLSSTDLKGIKK